MACLGWRTFMSNVLVASDVRAGSRRDATVKPVGESGRRALHQWDDRLAPEGAVGLVSAVHRSATASRCTAHGVLVVGERAVAGDAEQHRGHAEGEGNFLGGGQAAPDTSVANHGDTRPLERCVTG